MLICRAR